MAIFMNRNAGITETWGTVQFRIFCSGIASIQRGSKRAIEEIARLWLRVNGVQATPKFSHNLVDWNSEEQRMNVSLLKQEFYQIAQLMGWIDPNLAAQEVMGGEKAAGEPVPGLTGERQPGDGDGEGNANSLQYLMDRRRDRGIAQRQRNAALDDKAGGRPTNMPEL
jgi:hypothetical protein